MNASPSLGQASPRQDAGAAHVPRHFTYGRNSNL